jgi:hypothetical protein
MPRSVGGNSHGERHVGSAGTEPVAWPASRRTGWAVKDDPGAELFKQLEVPVLADGHPSMTEREGVAESSGTRSTCPSMDSSRAAANSHLVSRRFGVLQRLPSGLGSLTAVVEKLLERVREVHATGDAIGGRSESAGPAPLPTLGAAAFGRKTPPSTGLRRRANATCESRTESTANCPTGLAPLCAAQPPALSPPAPASPDATSR